MNKKAIKIGLITAIIGIGGMFSSSIFAGAFMIDKVTAIKKEIDSKTELKRIKLGEFDKLNMNILGASVFIRKSDKPYDYIEFTSNPLHKSVINVDIKDKTLNVNETYENSYFKSKSNKNMSLNEFTDVIIGENLNNNRVDVKVTLYLREDIDMRLNSKWNNINIEDTSLIKDTLELDSDYLTFGKISKKVPNLIAEKYYNSIVDSNILKAFKTIDLTGDYIHIYNTEKLSESELPDKIKIDANGIGIEGEYNFAKEVEANTNSWVNFDNYLKKNPVDLTVTDVYEVYDTDDEYELYRGGKITEENGVKTLNTITKEGNKKDTVKINIKMNGCSFYIAGPK
ncbi:hypothetical protein ACSW8S_17815 (plasmid) [Clostridium perfringens]